MNIYDWAGRVSWFDSLAGSVAVWLADSGENMAIDYPADQLPGPAAIAAARSARFEFGQNGATI